MSVIDRRGAQVHPDHVEIYADPDAVPIGDAIAPDDAWTIAAAIDACDELPETERRRLVWAVLDAAIFSKIGTLGDTA